MRQRKIYKASELPGNIQDELHEKNYHVLVEDSDWWESEWDYFQSEKTIETGLSFEEKSLEFDLDRGNYAKFKYSIEDTDKLIEVLGYSEQLNALRVAMKLMGADVDIDYSYETISINLRDTDDYFNPCEIQDSEYSELINIDSLNEDLTDLIESLQKELLNNLRQCYDGDTSKDAVIDFLDNNGYGYYYNRRTKEYEEAERWAIDETISSSSKVAA